MTTTSLDDRTDIMYRAELPTWLVLVANYALWLGLTWYHGALPWWVLLLLGGFTVCLHGSLQHECLHGHPTRWDWLNKSLVWLPIGLWMPYTIYRDSHIAHHQCEGLTDPWEDPESFYLSAEAWSRCPRLSRRILTINNSLAGRLLIGPPIAVVRFWGSQLGRLFSGDRRYAGVWLSHLAGSALVLYWVVSVCQMPLWQYLLFFAWSGLSLTLLRSYTEHRPARDPGQRTIIIEGSPLSRTLYLNNNFHHVHHADPGLAWYLIADRYHRNRERVNEENGGFYLRGYSDLFKKYLFKVKDAPVHPATEPS